MIILPVLIFPSCAGWNTTDKVLFGTFVTAQTIDTLQTIEILDNSNFEEKNPLVTSTEGLFLLKGASTAGVYLLADRFPRWRRSILIIGNVIVFGVVAHNYSIGIRITY